MTERIYLSGPMSSLSRDEYCRRFSIAEEMLRERGYKTINPCRVWSSRFPWLYRIVGYRLTLLYDLWLILFRADKMCFLPGWENSRGALIENVVSYKFKIREIDRDLSWEIYTQLINDTSKKSSRIERI